MKPINWSFFCAMIRLRLVIGLSWNKIRRFEDEENFWRRTEVEKKSSRFVKKLKVFDYKSPLSETIWNFQSLLNVVVTTCTVCLNNWTREHNLSPLGRLKCTSKTILNNSRKYFHLQRWNLLLENSRSVSSVNPGLAVDVDFLAEWRKPAIRNLIKSQPSHLHDM